MDDPLTYLSPPPKVPLEKLIPKHYHEFLLVFDKNQSECMPSRKQWDHAIDLKPSFKPQDSKMYVLSPK
jgi:hypothetical protein